MKPANGREAQFRHFNPATCHAFRFGKWQYSPRNGRLDLHYSLCPGAEFTETLVFPQPTAWPLDAHRRSALEVAFGLIHLLAGVSYYKCACPDVIELAGSGIDPELAGFLQSVYRNGLAEFACRNQLELPRIRFPTGAGAISTPPPLELSRRSLVPLGGGKDSLVTVELLRELGEPMIAGVVGQSPLILGTARRAQLDVIQIDRHIDQRLFALNRVGAYNGHVPVTAIISAIMVAAALLYDYDSVVLSNERSADEPNFYRDGKPVNHQWSKSSAFERQFQAILGSHVGLGLNCFSLLRPLSEMTIIRRFAGYKHYHAHFSSCNRNFQINPETPAPRWCGDCPKCRFVFLGLATVMSAPDLVEIFGVNLLDQDNQISGFLALAGAGEHKPFECVGSCGETRWAFRELAQQESWCDCRVVKAMLEAPADASSAMNAEPLPKLGMNDIPERFRYEL